MFTEQANRLHDAILDRFHQTISLFPPAHAPFLLGETDQPWRLGEQLVQLGYLTPRQLSGALHLRPRRAGPALLGRTLVDQALVPAPVISAVLLMQFLERIEHDPEAAPRFFGERLLLQERLDPDQLATVIHEQLDVHQYGSWVRLGELIVHHGWLDADEISSMVQRQAAQEH